MNPYARKLKFVNFYKLDFPLTYNPEIVTEPSVCKFHLHLTFFLHFENIFFNKMRQLAVKHLHQ